MSTCEKVDYYYNEIIRILEYTTFNEKCVELYIPDPEELKKDIESVVVNNNDYLLTPAYLDYIVEQCYRDFCIFKLGDELKSLNDEHERIKIMNRYLCCVFDDFKRNDLLNDYEQNLLEYLKIAFDAGAFNDEDDNKDYYMKQEIYYVIAAYVLVNQKTCDDFFTYIDDYLHDWKRLFDEIKLQIKIDTETFVTRYDYDFNELQDYVLKQIDDHKKEIR